MEESASNATNAAISSGETRRPWVHAYQARPSKFQIYPKFEASEMHECVRVLDPSSKSWDLERCENELVRYKNSVTIIGYVAVRLFPFMGTLVLVIFVLFGQNLLNLAAKSPKELFNTILFSAWITSGLLGSLLMRGRPGWGPRFYREINNARKAAQGGYSKNARMVGLMNVTGRAARFLFRHLQGRRTTWVSPPAVADRALAVTFPFINVSLGKELEVSDLSVAIDMYSEFLYYGAGLVAVGREDLVPALREKYSGKVLPVRSSGGVDRISKRDALFLDPMRNYNKWGVAKDFLYPLAAWFSLFIAIGALIVNLAR
jgi:hypothetical protein